MARPRKIQSIDERIAKVEADLKKYQEAYNAAAEELKELMKKKDEERQQELLKAVKNSSRTYEEIIAFLTTSDTEE